MGELFYGLHTALDNCCCEVNRTGKRVVWKHRMQQNKMKVADSVEASEGYKNLHVFQLSVGILIGPLGPYRKLEY